MAYVLRNEKGEYQKSKASSDYRTGKYYPAKWVKDINEAFYIEDGLTARSYFKYEDGELIKVNVRRVTIITPE